MKPEDHKYEGWTNYETWNVNLWLDNTQASQNYWAEEAREIYNDPELEIRKGFTHKEEAAFVLADELKDALEENMPQIDNNVYLDLLNASLSEVNWYEIASNLIEDLVTQEVAS